jgi:hypothetical protein
MRSRFGRSTPSVVGIVVVVLAALVIPLSSERVASAQPLSLQGKVVTGGGAPMARSPGRHPGSRTPPAWHRTWWTWARAA